MFLEIIYDNTYLKTSEKTRDSIPRHFFLVSLNRYRIIIKTIYFRERYFNVVHGKTRDRASITLLFAVRFINDDSIVNLSEEM